MQCSQLKFEELKNWSLKNLDYTLPEQISPYNI